MKKIGIFSGYFLPHLGGVERYVDKLSAALYRLGYEIVIVTSNEANLPAYEKKETYSIYRLPILNIVKERYPIPRVNAEYKKLINDIERELIDTFIVNTRFHLTSLVGARMGKRQHRPVFLIEHGTDHFTVNNKFLDFFGGIYEHILTSVVKRNVDAFYGVSKNCNIWSQHFGIKARGVFYNAISKEDKFKVQNFYDTTYDKDEIVIAYAGRLIKEKGVLNLIEAFKQLNPKNGKKVRLVVAGDGDLYNEILKNHHTATIDVVGRLDFNHVMSLYKRADIFVYPSLYPEGLPTSILEAGLMECAVIATPRGGTEEVIVDGQHGIIIDGTPESIRDALQALIDDDAARTSKAKAIMDRVVTCFDWDSVASEVDKEIKGFKAN